MLRFGLPLLLLTVLVGACATMSEEQCNYSDWEVVGREDGAQGRDIGRFQRYVEDCGKYGIRPDSAAYDQGRERGLDQFCTPVGVYTNGLRSRGNAALCGNDPNLVRIHRAAWEYSETAQELDRIRNAYDQIFRDRRLTRRDISRLRHRLRNPELSEEQREDLRRDLRRRYDDLDRYEQDEYRLRFRLRDLERDLNDAQFELSRIEAEFGLRGSRGRY